MTATEENQAVLERLGLRDLSNLAGSLSGRGWDEAVQLPASDSVQKAEPSLLSTAASPEVMQECRPVASGGLFALLHPECAHPYVEQFHQLRTQMLLHRTRLEALTDLRAITVMSTQRGEGKSFTATNLAAMMAAGSGERVLLVDANPEGPELPTGINGLSAGLSQALAEPSQWAQSVYTVKDSRLSLMPRGRVPGRSIDFAPLPRLLTQLRRHFEWIILDGTSFATSPDAEWLSSAADGTLLVAQGGTAKFDATTESLVRIPADRMLGVVFNNRPPQRGAFKVRIRFTGKW